MIAATYTEETLSVCGNLLVETATRVAVSQVLSTAEKNARFPGRDVIFAITPFLQQPEARYPTETSEAAL